MVAPAATPLSTTTAPWLSQPDSISPAASQSNRDNDTSQSRGNFRDAGDTPSAPPCCPLISRRILAETPSSARFPAAHSDGDSPPPASDRGFALGLVVEKRDTGGASLSEVEVEGAGVTAPAWYAAGAGLVDPFGGGDCVLRRAAAAACSAGSAGSSRLGVGCFSDSLVGDCVGVVELEPEPVEPPTTAALPA